MSRVCRQPALSQGEQRAVKAVIADNDRAEQHKANAAASHSCHSLATAFQNGVLQETKAVFPLLANIRRDEAAVLHSDPKGA